MLSQKERQKHIWDYDAAKDYYFNKGKEEGMRKARVETVGIEVILKAIQLELSNEMIQKLTGLSISEIN